MMLILNRRGEGAILTCTLLLVLAAVFSAVSEYTVAVLTVSTVKDQARETLDSYIWEEGIVSFGDLKRDIGSGKLSTEGFCRRLAEEKGLVAEEQRLCCLSASGKLQYELSDLSLRSSSEWHYTVSFTVSVPLSIAGAGMLRVPVSLENSGNFINKYGG